MFSNEVNGKDGNHNSLWKEVLNNKVKFECLPSATHSSQPLRAVTQVSQYSYDEGTISISIFTDGNWGQRALVPHPRWDSLSYGRYSDNKEFFLVRVWMK